MLPESRRSPRRSPLGARRRRLSAVTTLLALVVGGTGCLGGDEPPPPERRSAPAKVQPSLPTPEQELPSPEGNDERPARREERPALVWAVGDGGDGSAPAKRLAKMIAATDLDRLLYLGDVYENGTPEEFRENYDPVYGALAPVTSPTPGNHDWPNHEEGYDPYWRRAHGAPQPSYYSFSIGGWEILSLNSEDDLDEDSPQVRWLEDQLEGAEGTCRLAFWHRARYSAGEKHGDQPDTDVLWDALRGKAKLVVAGHEHNSQRFEPREGMTQLVAGAGRGAEPLYGLEYDPELVFGDDEEQAALRLKLAPGKARFAFVNAEGDVLDSDTVSCER